MQGTIPYLGTFLTDLVMLDTAMKDQLEVRWTEIKKLSSVIFLYFENILSFFVVVFFQVGLINFEKRRKVSLCAQKLYFIKCIIPSLGADWSIQCSSYAN